MELQAEIRSREASEEQRRECRGNGVKALMHTKQTAVFAQAEVAGDQERARSLALQYIEAYPDGRRSNAVRRFGGLP